VVLGGSPGSKAIQCLFSFAIEAAGEGMEAQFYCLISTLFSCLDEPSVLEGILIMKHFYFSDNPELSKEAVGIVICCLSRSTKCYKQWVSNLF
jgi:hypothetical protein